MSDRAVPNLPSRDFDATSAFYGGFGFAEHYRDEAWLILRRGSVELEFFPFPEVDPASSNMMCSVRVADLDGLHAAVHASGVPVRDAGHPRLTEITRQYWGARVAYLVDLDGTQLHLIGDTAEAAA